MSTPLPVKNYFWIPIVTLQKESYLAKKSINVGDSRVYPAFEVEARERAIIEELKFMLAFNNASHKKLKDEMLRSLINDLETK